MRRKKSRPHKSFNLKQLNDNFMDKIRGPNVCKDSVFAGIADEKAEKFAIQ